MNDWAQLQSLQPPGTQLVNIHALLLPRDWWVMGSQVVYGWMSAQVESGGSRSRVSLSWWEWEIPSDENEAEEFAVPMEFAVIQWWNKASNTQQKEEWCAPRRRFLLVRADPMHGIVVKFGRKMAAKKHLLPLCRTCSDTIRTLCIHGIPR